MTKARDISKLSAVEVDADATDTTNVTSSGALMDSELTNLAAVKAINQSLVTTAGPTFGSLTVDTMSVNGSSLTATGALTLDVAGDLHLDSAGQIKLDKNGTNFGVLFDGSGYLGIHSSISDEDIVFSGNDGGSTVTALTLDMSEAGEATFNSGATFGGNVGINTTNPQVKLQVNDSGTAASTSGYGTGFNVARSDGLIGMTMGYTSANNSMYIQGRNFTNNDTQPIAINPLGGNVGIGAISPAADYGSDTALEIKGASSPGLVINDTGQGSKYGIHADSNDLKITYGSGALATFQNDNRTGLGTTDPRHILDIEASTTGAIPTNADMGASNENDNYFSFHNSSNSATFSGLSLETRTSGASKWLIANEWKDTYLGDLVFRVRDGGTSSSEAMRIDSSGNVGIGITSPTEKFTVVNSSSGIVGRFTNNTNQTLDLGVISGSGTAGGVYYNSANAGYHAFQVGGTEYMRIDSSGNVGIGTTSPSDRLVVQKDSSNIEPILVIKNDNTTDDNGVSIDFAGKDTGSNNITYGRIATKYTNHATEKSHMIFSHRNDSGAFDEWMRVTHDGNVGIGTASPDNPLEVVGADSGIKISSASSSRPHLRFECGSDEKLRLSANSAYGAIGDGSDANRYMILKDGKVGINDEPTDLFYITGNATSTAMGIKIGTNGYNGIEFDNATGSLVGRITINSGTTAYVTSSDYRLKENVTDMTGATTRLKQLKPKRFNWIADNTNTLIDGFLAHEVSSIVPEAVAGEKDAVHPDGHHEAGEIDPQGIDHSKLVPLLVKTIQELEARITALEA